MGRGSLRQRQVGAGFQRHSSITSREPAPALLELRYSTQDAVNPTHELVGSAVVARVGGELALFLEPLTALLLDRGAADE